MGTPNKTTHKFVEFYDVRDAEAALNALNRTKVRNKVIKIEVSRPSNRGKKKKQGGRHRQNQQRNGNHHRHHHHNQHHNQNYQPQQMQYAPVYPGNQMYYQAVPVQLNNGSVVYASVHPQGYYQQAPPQQPHQQQGYWNPYVQQQQQPYM